MKERGHGEAKAAHGGMLPPPPWLQAWAGMQVPSAPVHILPPQHTYTHTHQYSTLWHQ